MDWEDDEDDEDGIPTDPLFVALTRPATIWGIPYGAFIILLMSTAIVFLAAGKLIYLAMGFPAYSILYLMSANDPYIFGSTWLWMKTLGRSKNQAFWGSRSFSPLRVNKWGND